MKRRITLVLLLLTAAMLISGCAVLTVDEMYAPPRRSAEYEDLQNAIDEAMPGLNYCAPLTGENQQTVQMADLNGDGEAEYLLFAKGASEMPLKILIFARTEEGCVLKETIESGGSAFELVEYVDIDGASGVELVVGRQVSDQVLRSLSVYTFSDGSAQQLMTANYSKFVTCDLDVDNLWELMVIAPGAAETDRASAALFSYDGTEMIRSREVSLSESADNIKRIMYGDLIGGIPAVYVASSVEESAIITDIFAMKNGRFTNVSLSSESGTSVQTLRNYYVYADDLDKDGILELPSLITTVSQSGGSAANQHLIRWYAMDVSGREVDKMYSFHNLGGGWYLELDAAWADRVSVTQDGGAYTFSVWDKSFQETKEIMTVYVLTGSERETAAMEEGRFLLHRGDEVVYAARLEAAAADYGITREGMPLSFHLIYKDWKTGETE